MKSFTQAQANAIQTHIISKQGMVCSTSKFDRQGPGLHGLRSEKLSQSRIGLIKSSKVRLIKAV